VEKENVKILIVDDDVSICRTMSLILENEGYKTETANTGKEAIEKSKVKIYNVALLDIKLPDIEGTKLLNALRETTPKMVKIMVTGFPGVQNAVEAVNYGADAYLTKPVDIDKLIKVIAEKLEKQKEAEKVTEEKISKFLEVRTQKLLQELE
jgi:DNA-binding NtrC family response regulator